MCVFVRELDLVCTTGMNTTTTQVYKGVLRETGKTVAVVVLVLQ